jgi:dihydroorotate dehydrogenase
MRPDDAVSLAQSIVTVLGPDLASRELRVSDDELKLIESGKIDAAEDVTLKERLTAWGALRTEELFRATGSPVPPFDHLEDFWVNFYDGPRSERPTEIRRKSGHTKLLDFELTFPFGVPACALTPHSGYIEFFAQRAFDLITYKTVRDRAWNPHAFPHWAFAVDASELGPTDFDRPVLATLDPGTRPEARTALVNSFGVPSLAPKEWQEDVREAKRRLGPGQVLVVSVMGTPEMARDNAELAQQFARTAGLAVEAGADIVEANLSCPNTESEELICQNPLGARAVVEAIEVELRLSRTPLFIKISYLEPRALEELVRECAPLIQGIVAINTVSVPVTTRAGDEFFEDRPRAGLSGTPIRSLALATARQLVDLREEAFDRSDFAIIGVGGVTTSTDFDAFMEVGVDVVQSCSGAWLNPGLACEIQGIDTDQASAPERFQIALLRALADVGERDPIEAAVAAKLTPSSARVALQVFSRQGWVEQRDRVVALTGAGRRALADMMRRGVSLEGGESDGGNVDAELDRAIARLQRG